MNYSTFAILAILIPLTGLGQGSKGCPWLNVATASGVLRSSENSPMATLAQSSAALCSFEYREASVFRQLLITVEQTQNPSLVLKTQEEQCKSKASPLQAIGNEAVACTVRDGGKISGDLIVGRVRDQIFTVKLTTNTENDPSMVAEAIESKTHMIAEQVAGALF